VNDEFRKKTENEMKNRWLSLF